VNQIMLCVVVIAFAGVPANGQDEHPGANPTRPFTESRQDPNPFLKSAPASAEQVVVGLDSGWTFSARPKKHKVSPFLFPVDSPSAIGVSIQKTRSAPDRSSSDARGVQWSAAIKQSLLFLGVQHGYAFTQPKTRRDLKGPFLKDYLESVKSLHGWEDGGRFFTNYIAHPMQGSLLGFVQIQNDPKGMNLRYNESPAYWRSRLKALAWAAVWSTQFEIGPVSQASLGNVGLYGKQTYVDIVMTPTAGIGLLVLEDLIDQKFIRAIERNSQSYYLKIVSRTFLNPTRSAANLLRLKVPWHRDEGLRSCRFCKDKI
jgi:hypothetical protein